MCTYHQRSIVLWYHRPNNFRNKKEWTTMMSKLWRARLTCGHATNQQEWGFSSVYEVNCNTIKLLSMSHKILPCKIFKNIYIHTTQGQTCTLAIVYCTHESPQLSHTPYIVSTNFTTPCVFTIQPHERVNNSHPYLKHIIKIKVSCDQAKVA